MQFISTTAFLFSWFHLYRLATIKNFIHYEDTDANKLNSKNIISFFEFIWLQIYFFVSIFTGFFIATMAIIGVIILRIIFIKIYMHEASLKRLTFYTIFFEVMNVMVLFLLYYNYGIRFQIGNLL